MSQRVNIQFSIDLEELPAEVERLVDKFGDELETTSELFSELAEDVISIAGLEDLNGLRLSLARADHILDDITKIAGGYIQMKTQPQEQEQQEADQLNPFTPNGDTLSGLEEKLRAFRTRMADEQPTEVTNNQQ
jgi:hypothetical protein